MTLALSNGSKLLRQNQHILRSGNIAPRILEPTATLSFYALVLIVSVRHKQRGHIPNSLVERHRQSPLGKAKAGAAVGVSPPRDDTNLNVSSLPHDFK